MTLATVILLGGSVGVALAKLEYSSPPEIRLPGGIPVPQHPKVGEELVCSSGSWNGSPSFTYEWVREGVQVSDSSTPGTYILQRADENHEVSCFVTATTPQGTESLTVESANGVCINICGHALPEPPKSTSPPVISGTVEVGKTVSCSQGEWSGSPTTFSYLWLRDKETAISGATSSSYTVKEEDATHKLSCRVTAKNAGGEAAAESTGVLVKGEAPRNTTRPKVQGTTKVGQTLTCNEGTWSGSKPITFRIEWLRDGASIGATGSTYVVQQPDEGQKLACRVTAENLAGNATEQSEAVTIAGEPIKATGVPTIEGNPKLGEILACSKASWNETPVREEYAWVRENPSTRAKESTGEIGIQYQISEADLGTVLYCTVTAYNSGNERASATSEGFPIPKGSGTPPEMIEAPAVQPKLGIKLGTTLLCEVGKWKNATQFAFQWLRDGVAIPNATLEHYTVEAADQSHQLACILTAENSEGATKFKTPGVSVPGEAPSMVSQPEVQGSKPPHVGESLTCVRGAWRGAPTPTFQYEWVRLPEGDPVAVGPTQNYTVTAEDRGHSLTCSVTATNPLGSAEAQAVTPIYVPGSAPVPPLEGPTIEHEAAVGKTVACNPGHWGGAPPPEFKFAWLVNGVVIAEQTQANFTVGPKDRGVTLQCKVTGSNSEGTASSTSKGVYIAGMRPENLASPYIEGAGKVGSTLTCLPGVWNGKPAPRFSYQWDRDDAAVEGASEPKYTIAVADQGHLITCTVTAFNVEGRVELESINGVVVPGHAVEASTTFQEASQTIPNAGVIIASLRRQLTTVLEKAHLRSVLAHGFTFSFDPPTRGTLEVMWYKRYKVKVPHHSPRTHYTLLARSGKSAYASVTRGKVRVKLTAAGKAALHGRKSVGIVVKAVFTVPGRKPVTWTGTVVLS